MSQETDITRRLTRFAEVRREANTRLVCPRREISPEIARAADRLDAVLIHLNQDRRPDRRAGILIGWDVLAKRRGAGS